jgi:ATP-binding cassette subfamily B protein
MQREEATPALSDKQAGWGSMLRPHAAALTLLLVVQAVQTIAALLLPSLSANVIDDGILAGDQGEVLRMGGLMVTASAVQLVFSVAAVFLGVRIATNVAQRLRRSVFQKVHSLSLAEIHAIGVPSLITRCTNDVQQVQTALTMLLTIIVSAPIMGVGGVVMAARENVRLTLLMLLAVPILAAIIGLLMARSLPWFQKMQTLLDRVNAILREQISGVRVIRAFVRDNAERERFGAANDELTAASRRAWLAMALNIPALTAVMQLTGVAMVWAASDRIIAGELDVGVLVAFLSYMSLILISVMMAGLLFVLLPRATVSVRRIREVLGTSSTVLAPAQPQSAPARQRAELAFHHVGFQYAGASAAVLADVSFRIGPGETLGIIGATGSGKSTLVSLVPRLYDPTEGRITVGGVDLRDFSPEDLWSAIGLVPQKAWLFSGTVAENLRYGRADASDEDLWQALEVAQARDFIAAKPQGLDARVAQGGGNFSGGQRQRLTIARALVRRPQILLLDDSFSALDAATDVRVRRGLRQVTADAATIIVGQRISSIKDANRILVLDHGRIVGQGDHETLLRDCPIYAEIVASQLSEKAA